MIKHVCNGCNSDIAGSNNKFMAKDFLEVTLKNPDGPYLHYNVNNHGSPPVLHFCNGDCVVSYYSKQTKPLSK